MILSLDEYNMDVHDSPELRAVDCNSVPYREVWVDEDSYCEEWLNLVFDDDVFDNIPFFDRWEIVDDALYNAGVRIIGDTQ